MIRVGLGHCQQGYDGIAAPWGPGKSYPEIERLLSDRAGEGPFNEVYAAVRDALHGLGLDDARFGTPEWNPIGDLVPAGKRIVLKPNLIRHWNPADDGRGGTVDSVITHGAVIRAVADYAMIAAGPEGSVAIAEAPQMDCDFDKIRKIVGLDEIVAVYDRVLGRELEVIDLRREAVIFKDGIIDERKTLPGDPAGYRAVDLGDESFFTGSGLDPNRFRGADYDPGPTAEHHSGGRNAYLLSETVLSADLVINLPKLKTHKKTGVTLAIKNMVGINGDKNWLPHHSLGPVGEGGLESRPWLERVHVALNAVDADVRVAAVEDFVAGDVARQRVRERQRHVRLRCRQRDQDPRFLRAAERDGGSGSGVALPGRRSTTHRQRLRR